MLRMVSWTVHSPAQPAGNMTTVPGRHLDHLAVIRTVGRPAGDEWQSSSRGIDSRQRPGVQTQMPHSGWLSGPLCTSLPVECDAPSSASGWVPQSTRSVRVEA